MTRRNSIIAGAALAALVVAFLTGRYTARPAPVAVKDTMTSKTSSQSSATSASVAHVEAIAHESDTGDTEAKTHTIIRWLPAVPGANGCPAVPAHVEQETTTETHAETARTADKRRASNVVAKQTHQASAQQTVVELHTVTPVRPRWSVSLMPGYQWHGTPFIDAKGPLVIGASVEHRFIGPLSIGLWGSTVGAAGITLRGDL